MKRFTLLFSLLCICLMALAQSKLTPQAQLAIAKQKAKIERNAARPEASSPNVKDLSRITLVVKVAKENAATTFAQLKEKGAVVRSKLGRQAVISVPIDSIEAISQIKGVLQIDKGHKGRLKTDVTREETGVNKLNGPEVSGSTTAYTGKGVTICLIDVGFDFQHPAFKDADGNSRIKCVYMIGSEEGHKFTVNDPEAGTYTFPGTVFDTPELIASLTTDYEFEYHGTHTASIAAGSISPQGFGGMAPEADLVLIPFSDVEVEGMEESDSEDYMELALAFASAYAEQNDQPMVLSVSANSHSGPHDGTSLVTEAIENASENLIPVFSAGNEGGYPVHLYNKFTSEKPSIKTLLLGLMDDETGMYEYGATSDVVGFTRTGDEVSVQVDLKTFNAFTGQLKSVWTSEKCTATFGSEEIISLVNSDDDATLAKYFDGYVGVAAQDYGDGRLAIAAGIEGGLKSLCLFQLTLSGSDGTEIDAWDEVIGFGGVNYIGLPGYVDGDSEMSGGDWTCTDRVVSVGAYCANVLERSYDGLVIDTSVSEDEDDDVYVANDIAWFSSYGTSFNGVVQPFICSPGVNIVSAWNHYCVDESETVAENMQWQGYPYGAESGTSMACPAVAGIVALWLQANPDMTLDDVKNVMKNSATSDSYTGKNTERWGFGKIDAAKGIEYITQSEGIRAVTDLQNEASSAIIYDLSGRRLSGKPAHGIYISNGHKIMVK